jgi:alpha-L-arabinofuranosidase
MQISDDPSIASARTIHVAPHGQDNAVGSADAPLQTIGEATRRAMPGDIVTIHAGIYREEINPPRGGTSDDMRITYTAANNETVEIRGSEIVEAWQPVSKNIWLAEVDNALFGDFNPFADRIRGDWFLDNGRKHHTGAVYLDNQWLAEAASVEDLTTSHDTAGHWYAEVTAESTRIWAHFNGRAPDSGTVEINVRQSVFYPRQTGINYITLRGLTMRHAATPWAPPTAEQIGLVGTNWSKGWIIEDNTISHSRCCGICLGKHGDTYDNTSQGTAEGYDKTIERAFDHNWNREHIGSHIVRNNHISFCEQAGIVGSLGAIFSSITGNTIHDIHQQRLFSGAEQAGIKLHAPIDTLIADNRIFRSFRALWMDWMTQGTRISRNLCFDNSEEDLHMEVNHGPSVVDHNIFLSPRSLNNWSQGGAYIHNLFAGKLIGATVLKRTTPCHAAHSTELTGSANIQGGDERFYNNLIVDKAGYENHANPARPCGLGQEKDGKMTGDAFPIYTGGNRLLSDWSGFQIDAEQMILQIGNAREPLDTTAPSPVDSSSLGHAQMTGLPYLDVDGQELSFDTDYFGAQRSSQNPEAGPFESNHRSVTILLEGLSLR